MSQKNRQPKRIAITGAGSGLGRALALRYGRAGARVAVTDIQAGRARRVAGEVNDAGGEAMAQTLDTRRDADFEQLLVRLNDEWGGVDIFVNNAGVASSGTVADTPPADWDWLIDINLMGVVRGCRAALPAIRASRGCIVNTASFAAVANAPGMVSYNVAKAGVLSLSETLRAEEYANGVSVTVACPAFFATNLMDSFRSTTPGREALVEKLMARSGVTAEDVADQIYNAVAARRFLVLTHRDTRWQYRLKRLQPELFFRVVERVARTMLKPGRQEPA